MNVVGLLRNIKQVSRQITSNFKNWYRYRYDVRSSEAYSIRDGGLDMYDSGNIVRYFFNTL